MLKISKLTCEYQEYLLGTDIKRPRFSWQLLSDKKETKQRTYRIKVSLDPSFEKIIWDTGEFTSEQSILIPYKGIPLKSFTRYFYKVKASDNHGDTSDWSSVQWFETAFLDDASWSAKWIAPKNQETLEEVFALRNELKVNGSVKSARVYMTSLGLYQLHINGNRIGDALLTPGWTSYQKRLQYQTYDVTDVLVQGENAIGIELSEGWYKGMGFDGRYEYGDDLAALFELHVEYEDGQKEVFISDENWKSGHSAIVSAGIYNGETYDARLKSNWSEPGFNDSDWQEVDILEPTTTTLVAQESEPVRVTETVKPIKYLLTPKGEKVLDMGQNMVGRMRFSVSAPEGTKITLSHAEVLDKDGNFYTENLRTAKQQIVYIAKGDGVEIYAPTFTFMGFRYVKVEGFPGNELPLDNFIGEVFHTDMERTGEFITDNLLVNRLHENIVWGQRGNFVDVPTDCPQRNERLGWTGDAQVFVGTALFNYNGASFFKKWLHDLKVDQKADGQVPYVIPNIIGANTFATGWSDAATVIPWTVYQVYGDKDLLENQYESMKAWVEKVRSMSENGTIWKTKIQFGDWLSLDGDPNSPMGATPNPLLAACYHAYSTKIVANAARVLGYEDDVKEYESLYERIADDFQNEFVTANGTIIGGTQTSYVVPLAFNLIKGEQATRAAHELHRMIVENNYHLTTGFLGTPFLLKVLSDHGYHETALRLLLQEDYPSWLYQVKQGATTIWERWNSMNPDGSFNDSGMTSFNHYAYGAIGEWMHTYLAGISADASVPGYKKINIAPKIHHLGVNHVKATLHTGYGKVASEWKILDDVVTLTVSIPVNTEAFVQLPEGAEQIKLDGSEITEKQIDLGSGDYSIRFTLPQLKKRVFTENSVIGELIYYPEAKAILEESLTNFMNGTVPAHVAFHMVKGMTFKEFRATPETYLTNEQVDNMLAEINKLYS